MGAVNTTYTFTATDTITSTKMNNIIDETVMTADAVLGGSGGSGGLDIASGKLSISANAINNSRLASNSVTSANIVDGTIVNADINASAAIAGTKISPSFGGQTIRQDGANVRMLQYNGSSVAVTDFGIGAGTGFQDSIGLYNATSTGVVSFGTNSTERLRITASGNVGIGTDSPSVPLHVQGQSVTNSVPELTITGSSGYINFHNSLTQGSYNAIVSEGDKSIIFSDGTSDTGAFVIAPWATNASGIRINSSGNVGICKASPSTALDVNGTVTATAFAGPLTGNVTGDVTGNASSASTVSNGAITAAKLDGNQSGSAPIYGVRAWGVIDIAPTRSLFSGANISSTVTAIDSTHTQITFSTAMSDTGYVVSGCPQNDGTLDFATYDHQTTGFKIRHSTATTGRKVQFMVIR